MNRNEVAAKKYKYLMDRGVSYEDAIIMRFWGWNRIETHFAQEKTHTVNLKQVIAGRNMNHLSIIEEALFDYFEYSQEDFRLKMNCTLTFIPKDV